MKKIISVLLSLAALMTVAHAQTTTDLRINCDGAGPGEIAIRIRAPLPAQSRYDHDGRKGSGIVVMVPGGSGEGTLSFQSASEGMVREGLIVVKFLFPGGAYLDPGTGLATSSDGTYDYRGKDSMRALRDVMRYALGLDPDISGKYIQTSFPNALTSNVGIIASSNGGNISWCTMARFGASMSGIAFYGGWENPSNAQTCTGELGTIGTDPDTAVDSDGNGIPDDDGTNPHFRAYGSREFRIDYRKLAYQVTSTTTPGKGETFSGFAWLDGNQNGIYDSPVDINGNGRLDRNEDFALNAYSGLAEDGSRLVYYSVPLRRELQRRGFALNSDVASLEETIQYWKIRELAQAFPKAGVFFPDLLAMTTFSEMDHVQSAHADDGHFHIQQLVDGLSRSGIWFRTNPDREYIELIGNRSGESVPVETVDADANLVLPPGSLHILAEPESISMNTLLAAMAVELADRVHMEDRSENISDGPLVNHR